METNKENITSFFKSLQDEICHAIEMADGKATFTEDTWQREGGGGGRSRIIAEGNVIEKGGVGFSAVYGDTPDKILNALQLEKSDFYATGVSIVLHPENPMVPIIHMNVRYFEMSNGVWWFGGGIDLTPHYVDESDATYFHQKLKAICDLHDSSYYPRFKAWADDYFYIKHRNETRGIGGIFFDKLDASHGKSKSDIFEFVKEVGHCFAPIYTFFMAKNGDIPYDEADKNWQLLRRSRYVEFNLILDAGTKFGLDTNGRTESILMSMPPVAKWVYNYQAQNEREARTLGYLRKNINWI
ncbi:MAG TPA: oxygen-dependent coproporphyrinogen oxidase [Cytophagales bacterium]|nr:oxygen-dependent coproporphyrinogen oxidase [Cytophagales bacterium]